MLVSPGDPRELADSVQLLLDDEGRATALAAAGRESVLSDATVDRYAERLLEVCRRALVAG